MKLQFTKMSGAGNDFVVIDNLDNAVRGGSDLATRICDRHWGVGADGLLLVEKSTSAAYRMMYYNADGSYGGMCGNGGRCIAEFCCARGLAPAEHDFEALDHVYHAVVGQGTVKLSMKDPWDIRTNLMLPVIGKKLKATFLDTGSPHVVILAKLVSQKGLSGIDVTALGRKIRHLKLFGPEGTNVNFIEVTGNNSLNIRTYERGVESDTLACGTGSIASAVAGSLSAGMKPPVTVTVRSGSKLTVDFEGHSDGMPRNVRLTGPVATVFEGVISV